MAEKTIKVPKMKSLQSEKTTKEKMNDTYDNRPSICFNETELPAVADWKVGETYKVIIEIEQQSSAICDYGDNKGKMEGRFKISSVGVVDDEDDENEETE